jgi:murein DD-endopeptidase MepM/ murein hydrolase activator NlpD
MPSEGFVTSETPLSQHRTALKAARASCRNPQQHLRGLVGGSMRRTLIAPLLVGALALPAAGHSVPAAGATRVRSALLERRAVAERAREVRRIEGELSDDLRRRIERLRSLERSGSAGIHASDADRRDATVAAAGDMRRSAHQRIRELQRWLDSRVGALHRRYGSIQRWLDSAGIFRVCPVPAFIEISNNFGVTVRLPHVPVHIHQGDDVAAPLGSPIVAPFDGYATTGRSKLGGLEIRVWGEAGYVYNAHLSSVAPTGSVRAGDVIGYVGMTGDASGPHDHIEWHPRDGPAIDPYALLAAACLPAT